VLRGTARPVDVSRFS
jgi:predicted amidohydrolase